MVSNSSVNGTNLGDEVSQRLKKLTYPARLNVNNFLKDNTVKVEAEDVQKIEDKKILARVGRPQTSSNEFFGQETRSNSSSSKKSSCSIKLFKSNTKIIPVESTPVKRGPTSPFAAEKITETEKQISFKFRNNDGNHEFDTERECAKSGMVPDRLKEIAEELSRRAVKAKEYVNQPPTPSTGTSEEDESEELKPPPLKRTRTIIIQDEKSSSEDDLIEITSRRGKLQRFLKLFQRAITIPETIEPQSRLNITWLFIACCSYIYNAWMVPMRSIFDQYQTKSNLPIWFAFDYFCDVIYLIDILIFKMRVKFLKEGTWVTEKKEIRKAYLRSYRFAVDLVSLLPLDLLYLYFGPISAFRFPRMLKISVFFEFFERVDSVLSKPFIARLVRSVIYMVYSIHVYALVYFGFSKYEGIGSNSWVFQGVGNAYIRCYFFAIKTATSIGKNPKPVNAKEQALMTVAWLSGVFLFAVLIGQVKDIVLTANKNQNEFRRTVDETIKYLNKYNVPASVIERVRLWFSYTWKTQKTLDEIKALKCLPVKLQLDLAINVHIQTLSKVQLFRDCDENLLRDLVLKLRPVIYLPGDYVCRKGEVGKEMYIVKTGQVQVVGGPKGDTVFVTLSEGSVFGEISLLALDGGNRRTADVRSHGFSNLFVLSKEDLQITIKDHPEAQRALKKKASKLIKDTKERERSLVKEGVGKEIPIPQRQQTRSPKLLTTVFQMAPRGSVTESLRLRSIRLKSKPTNSTFSSLDRKRESKNRDTKNHIRRNGRDVSSDEDEEILIVETEGVSENQIRHRYISSEPPTHPSGGSVLEEKPKMNSSSTFGIPEDDLDHDEWIESIYGNAEDSFQILKSLNENINFIPEEDRVTYSLTTDKLDYPDEFGEENGNRKMEIETECVEKLKEENLCLKADNLIRSFDKLNEVCKQNDKNKKRKGIIDLGGSEESEDWTQSGLDSPRSLELNQKEKPEKKPRSNFCFESSSSRESFYNFGAEILIPSFSSDSGINKF